MYNAKIIIATALSTDNSLIAIIPKIRMFDGSAVFSTAPVYPHLTYEEIANLEGLHADDVEIESEVTYRFHIWGNSSLSALAEHIDRILHSIGFGRNYSQDQDETLDSGIIIKHKIMSFTGQFTI